jgi:hypothetical protein
MSRNEIVPVKREVIEGQLLAALDDKSKVAMLLNESDLDFMIWHLMLARNNRMGSMLKCDEWIADLTELKNAAFPNNPPKL